MASTDFWASRQMTRVVFPLSNAIPLKTNNPQDPVTCSCLLSDQILKNPELKAFNIKLTTAICKGTKCSSSGPHPSHFIYFRHTEESLEESPGIYQLAVLKHNLECGCCINVVCTTLASELQLLEEFFLLYFRSHKTFKSLLQPTVFNQIYSTCINKVKLVANIANTADYKHETVIAVPMAVMIAKLFKKNRFQWETVFQIHPMTNDTPSLRTWYQLPTLHMLEFVNSSNKILAALQTTGHKSVLYSQWELDNIYPPSDYSTIISNYNDLDGLFLKSEEVEDSFQDVAPLEDTEDNKKRKCN